MPRGLAGFPLEEAAEVLRAGEIQRIGHLLEEGVIHPEQPRLDEIAAQETDKARRKAKRQVLQEMLVQMQADGKGLELR